MKISLILPSLNVVKYIEECLESVINQTLNDLEVICVDAGSTDGTLEIIKCYQEKDDRIRLLVSEKKSYGYQMNIGILHAKGEYIGIVETDDYIMPKMCEHLYKIAKDNNLDFVKADFYRFIKKGTGIEKVRNNIFGESYMYNRVINPREEIHCFDGIMNTWSGIYKRSFLIDNNILHNESLGASFQDNGFWFLSFAYAERVMFYNNPYYMNRRDNMSSSVYSRGKIYCICDEYEYIFTRINSNKQLCGNLGKCFIKASLNAYRANYYRIAIEDRKSFIERWSKNIQLFASNINNCYELLDVDDSHNLIRIMNSPNEFIQQCNLLENDFENRLKKESKFVIFGAGMVGQSVLRQCIDKSVESKIACFAVSSTKNNYSEYNGIPIVDIDKLDSAMKECLIILAILKKGQPAIEKMLNEKGFYNVIGYPALV